PSRGTAPTPIVGCIGRPTQDVPSIQYDTAAKRSRIMNHHLVYRMVAAAPAGATVAMPARALAHLRSLVSTVVALAVLYGVPRGAAGAQQLSPQVLQQVEALMQEKAARSLGQRKIGSQLLYAAKQRRGEPIAPGLPSLLLNVETDASARTL